MKISNINAVMYIEILKQYLDRDDYLGYAAARNIRRLQDTSVEYIETRNKLINKYGSDQIDDDGNKTGYRTITSESPNFKDFYNELETFNKIEHDVEITLVPSSEIIGKLTGSQILDIDWMLED